MRLPLLLDSNILACVVRPALPENMPVATAVLRLLADEGLRPCVPEIADYELRRKLLHLAQRRHQGRAWARESLVRLNDLTATGYVPHTTEAMRMAAEIWAQERANGRPTADEMSLDADVILAAQARQEGGHVVTLNERHFRNLVEIFDWRPYRPSD